MHAATPSDRCILYVDDEKSNRVVFEQSFRARFPLRVVASAREALEVLAQVPVAVLVTDQRMPEMSGNELLLRAKALYPEVVRVVITAYGDLEPILRAVNEGLVARYILKPWDRVELETTLAWAMEAYALGQQDSELQLRLMRTERLVTLGSIAGAILHDVAGPLSFMHGNVERMADLVQSAPALRALIEGKGTLDPQHRRRLLELADELPEIVADMTEGAEMLVELTQTLNKIMRESSSSKTESADPAASARFAASVCKRLVNEARATVTLDCPADTARVAVNPTQLSQALINLMTNALHAVAAKGAPGGAVVLSIAPAGDRVLFTVTDNGVGMPAEVREKAGTVFFTTRAEGTGLGLSQVKRIVGKCGGTFELDSSPGQGTRARFTLPRALSS